MGKEPSNVFDLPFRRSNTSPERLRQIKEEVKLKIYPIDPRKIAEKILNNVE